MRTLKTEDCFFVAGGGHDNDADGGGFGGGGNYGGGFDSNGNEVVAGTFCTFAGIVVGLATTVATTSPALGAYLGFTTSWACEVQSGSLASNGHGTTGYAYNSYGQGGGSEG